MKKNIVLALSFYLGLVMAFSGLSKIINDKDLPDQYFLIEQYSGNTIEENITNYGLSLRYDNFKFGLQQSGFFWQFLALSEFLFGLLLLFARTRIIGALLMLPITLNIFLMHAFLEIHEILELFYVFSLFCSNIIVTINYKDLLNQFIKKAKGIDKKY